MWQNSAVIVERLIGGIDTFVSVEPTACAKWPNFDYRCGFVKLFLSLSPCWCLTTQTIINYTYRSLFVQWHEDDFSKRWKLCVKKGKIERKNFVKERQTCVVIAFVLSSQLHKLTKTSFFAAWTSRCSHHDVVAQIAALHWRRRWP